MSGAFSDDVVKPAEAGEGLYSPRLSSHRFERSTSAPA
jgi:hypothetical protein